MLLLIGQILAQNRKGLKYIIPIFIFSERTFSKDEGASIETRTRNLRYREWTKR